MNRENKQLLEIWKPYDCIFCGLLDSEADFSLYSVEAYKTITQNRSLSHAVDNRPAGLRPVVFGIRAKGNKVVVEG